MKTVLVLLIFLSLWFTSTYAADPWLTIEGKGGIGKGQHIVFVTGEEYYRSEEGMAIPRPTGALTDEVWEKLKTLIKRYLTADQGYTSRRALFETRHAHDYDHLARFGEWEVTDLPKSQDVG